MSPFGPLTPRIKAPGQHRRRLRAWYRANVIGKVRTVSCAAYAGRGTRTPDRRKA